MRRFCIIGAGACGLAIAKTFVERGIPFDCFEALADIGGIWNPDNPHVVYGSTFLNSSKRLSRLEPVSGGLPLDVPLQRRPIDVARAEMNLVVREVPGRRDNPRIVMYHQTTAGGAAPDETAWCSSFVNYCVEQAGLRGTDSKWA